MLLFIIAADSTVLLNIDFNTSHVTVYRKENYRKRNRNVISIHLMLLFINMEDKKTWK